MAKCTICGKLMVSGYCVCNSCFAEHFVADKLAQVEVHSPELPDRSGMRELVRLANLNLELEIIWMMDTMGDCRTARKIKSVELGEYVTAGNEAVGVRVYVHDRKIDCREMENVWFDCMASYGCIAGEDMDIALSDRQMAYNSLPWELGIIVRIG